MFVAKYVLISIMLSKLVGTMFVQICDIQRTIIFKPMMSYQTDQAANVASCHMARWHSVSQISSNTYPIIPTLPLFLYIVTGGHSFPHNDKKL